MSPVQFQRDLREGAWPKCAAVWKFPLEVGPVVEIPVSQLFELVAVGCQDDHLFLWMRVATSWHQNRTRRFRVLRTGQKGAVGVFVGTVLIPGVNEAWHVFDVTCVAP